MTTTVTDPSFQIVAYRLVADNTVDTSVIADGTQGDDEDGDHNIAETEDPDVQEVVLFTFATYQDGVLQSAFNTYHTIEVSIDTSAATLNCSYDGTAATPLDFSLFKKYISTSVNVFGIDELKLTALNAINVDNVSYTVDGADTYSPSIRK